MNAATPPGQGARFTVPVDREGSEETSVQETPATAPHGRASNCPALPRTRGDCPAERPCPFAGHCRYGLPAGACALDVAGEGEHTLEEIAATMGLAGEQVRQTELSALRKLARRPAAEDAW